ncbi:MAG: DUF3859 domain-containing protein [Hyphomicrobiales bacterium]|nr:DUF3859 domain-containing protein [Hyphomicrobiales bacterium]
MRCFLALLFSAAVSGAACAQAGRIERVEIVEAGLYEAVTASIQHAPGTATGRRNVLRETKLIAPATRIEARIGVHFGMRYRILGRPSGATVRLVSVTRYPAPGLKNPASDIVQTRGEHMLFATIGAINYRGYVFEQPWEMVPGTWVFELWDGDRKLASQTFEVVKP